MSDLLKQIRHLNKLGSFEIAEPFAGGAGASLSLLYQEETPKIHLNDADPAIYSFWWSLLNQPVKFLNKIDDCDIDICAWNKQREIYKSTKRTSKLDKGFAAFFLNRCNRSGIIINGGPIGGIEQTGNWKINARFNKPELRKRCERIIEFRERISVTNLDGQVFLDSLNKTKTLFFVDPPYYAKGGLLYLNLLDPEYHSNLSKKLRKMSEFAWVLTYDDCPEIRVLYSDWANIHPFSLRYAAARRRNGQEILITPKWMSLPSDQDSNAIIW